MRDDITMQGCLSFAGRIHKMIPALGCAEFFKKLKNIFVFSVIPLHWNGVEDKDLFFLHNTMAADDLVSLGARPQHDNISLVLQEYSVV